MMFTRYVGGGGDCSGKCFLSGEVAKDAGSVSGEEKRGKIQVPVGTRKLNGLESQNPRRTGKTLRPEALPKKGEVRGRGLRLRV